LFLPVNPHGHWQLNVLFWIKQVPPLKQLLVIQSGILQLRPVNANEHVQLYNPLPKFKQVPPLRP